MTTSSDEPFAKQNLALDIDSPTNSLAQIWAKKYVQDLLVDPATEEVPSDTSNLEVVLSSQGRAATVEKLQQALRFTSAQAWAKTEELLAQQVQRHRINPELIDPWQIAVDSRFLFEKALGVYTEQAPTRAVSLMLGTVHTSTSLESATELPAPSRLSVAIAQDVGKIRHKYTSVDPRIIGFVSMQFHYSGQLLLDLLSPVERAVVASYFKVIDDHLYMPLQRSYEAAANQSDFNSAALLAVRQLLPISSEIAKAVCDKVAAMYPTYRCYSGELSSAAIKISSLRDTEMFQVYLCLCVLEGNYASLQQELFPLCVMLYPPLQVSWELIRNMLRLVGQEISDRLSEEHIKEFRPYIRALWEMFSNDVVSQA
ncbi:hypothetical protein V2H45_13785 [Tumidithrix elongata RA019]|uniref:Uncharacterized protein n=1 Tax=Tumidithrix elongata BACA0141 TaxID=2716417 RepID=A0AAW9Q4P3_9CYAN|nr:hypothetical protein [Tumidithrix elongata RA019]